MMVCPPYSISDIDLLTNNRRVFFCSVFFFSSLATVLFLNLRVDKEGLDRNGLRVELGLDVVDETELVADDKYDNENPTAVVQEIV
jgi:hypothetical protein